MKTLQIQYEHNGTWWDLWQTDAASLQEAWNEIDAELRPTQGAWIKFEGEDEMMSVNGGFQ